MVKKAKPVHKTIEIPANAGQKIKIIEKTTPKTAEAISVPQSITYCRFSSKAIPIPVTEWNSNIKPT